MLKLQNKVAETINRHRLLSNGDTVLVAVSGGPDSVALLQLLWELRDPLNLHLEVAHLQHGLRGEESKKDAELVAELAAELKLAFHLKEIDLPEIKSKARKGNLEALARRERHGFFAAVARQRSLAKVALGHTLDDQAETILMWLLRGSGVKGLGGMAPMQHLRGEESDAAGGITMVRPMIELTKAEILQFLETKHCAYRLDRSNLDSALLRNWIRLHLLPQLKQRIDAHLPFRLARQAELLRDEENFLESLARVGLNKIRGPRGLSRGLLLAWDKAMQRRLMRLWIQEARGHLRGIEFNHVDRLLGFISQEAPQGRFHIPGGWELHKEYDTLKIEKRVNNPMRLCYNYDFVVGKELRIPEADAAFHSERLAAPLRRYPDDLMEAVMDMAALTTPLKIRNFRSGDRFQPLGMRGHKKLKDLFIEKKVPLALRGRLPLLCMGVEILWIPGYGRSDVAKIDCQTTSILHLKAVPCH